VIPQVLVAVVLGYNTKPTLQAEHSLFNGPEHNWHSGAQSWHILVLSNAEATKYPSFGQSTTHLDYKSL